MAEKLKIIPLGGLDEIGKNCTVLEYGKDMIVIDCGVGFPEEDMYGVDLVIPDFTYLVANQKKLRGMFITHGHEDHIGSIPYAMRDVSCPIHGTSMTCGLIKLKLEEHRLADKVKLVTHKPGDVVKAGCFTVEFIHVNHSIPDAVAFAIRTPVGTVIFTGDFKIDPTSHDGMMDLARLGELGNQGVLAMLADSTNVERPGYTMSERAGNLVGVVTDVGLNWCRLSTVLDTDSQFGARVFRTGETAVAGGDLALMAEGRLRLQYLSDSANLIKGDVIVTSGLGGYYPAGLVIGTVESVQTDDGGLARYAVLSPKCDVAAIQEMFIITDFDVIQ